MKTNPFVRSLLKVRVVFLLVAAVAMAGAGLALGDVLPLKPSHTVETIHHAPNVGLAEAFNLGTH